MLFPQRVKELEEEGRAGSGDFVGPVDPRKVAELFLECPRMEQRFFGFRFENLSADGLTLPFLTLNKVFTTMATIQELPLKTRLALATDILTFVAILGRLSRSRFVHIWCASPPLADI